MKRDIIYVDDEPDNIIVFEAAFEDDFNVWTARSGQETLELLDRIPVPVVVADQRMPEMSGVELFEIMRQCYPHIKRIILTGYSDSEAMLDAINKGQVFHFVKKPWERHELLSILLKAIEAHDLSATNSVLTEKLVVSERCSMLGQAAARITHEMSNQLCMLPLLEHIEEKYSDHEDLVRISQFARETHERLVALVNEVKSFMQFEHEQFPRESVSLSESLNELVPFLRFDEKIPYERLKLQISVDPMVVGNKVKLQQVFVNLIKNAAHAVQNREDGQISLTLDTEDNEAVLTVADNGCGMSQKTLQSIWEPYFTTKGKEGTGLGLDISRKLIEDHGGTIACESAPDMGTTFTIRLPFVEIKECVPVMN